MNWETALREFRRRNASERIQLISQVVDFWYGPSMPEDPPDVPASLMPRMLRLFHEKLGGSLGTVCRQNTLMSPQQLRPVDGLLMIAVENQGVYAWATPPAPDDPPIFGRFQGVEAWTQEECCLSEFLLGFVLLEAIFAAPRGASAAWLDPPAVEAVVNQMKPLGLPAWRWPAYPGRFFIREHAHAVCCPNAEDSSSFWMGGKEAYDVAFVRPLIGPKWEHVAL